MKANAKLQQRCVGDGKKVKITMKKAMLRNKSVIAILVMCIFAIQVVNAVPAAPSPNCEITANVLKIEMTGTNTSNESGLATFLYYKVNLDILEIATYKQEGTRLCDNSYIESAEGSSQILTLNEYNKTKISEGQKIKGKIHFGGDELLGGYFLSDIQVVSAEENATSGDEGTPAALTSADASIKAVSAGTVTIESVKTDLANKYSAGELKKAGLKKVLTVAYNHQKLTRANVQWLLGTLYKDGKLTRADLKWIIVEAYKKGELRRDDLRFIIIQAYKEGQLTREDVKWLIIESYKAGELKRDDLKWILFHAYKQGQLTREDLKWLIIDSYKAGELKRDDIRELLTFAYNQGELTRADLKWLLIESYKAHELTRDDIREMLTFAYNHGQLTRGDLKWLLVESYKAGELTVGDLKEVLKAAHRLGQLRRADIEWLLKEAYRLGELKETEISVADATVATVETQPAAVPSIPTVSAAAVAVSQENAPELNTESLVNTTEAMVLYKYALIPIETHRIGMDALIGFFKDSGKDTSKLETLKAAFISEKAQLESAANDRDVLLGRGALDSMRKTVASFRTEARSLAGGNTTGAAFAVSTALLANTDYLDSLVTDARSARRDRNLEIFDLTVARAQARLDFAKSQGRDTGDLQAKLDEIMGLRNSLIDAMNSGIEACKGEGIGKCTSSEVPEYVKLRNSIAKDFAELAKMARNKALCVKVKTTLDQADRAAGALEVGLGADKMSGIKSLLSSAKEKYNKGNCTEAAKDIKGAVDAYNLLRANATPVRRGR